MPTKFLDIRPLSICFLTLALGGTLTQAEDGCSGLACDTDPTAVAAMSCVDPRTTLFDDCLGLRSPMAAHGISVDADSTMFYMGVVDGGRDRDFRFGGHNDYVFNIDASKMGGPEGLFVKLRAEHRFGQSLGDATGALLPANVNADLPVRDSEDVFLTNVLFTQMLSETFGVFFGKLDTLDGDMNAFAHGRGKSQFSNQAFVATPIALRTTVYSTLGAGFVILGEDQTPLFQFSILNAINTTTSAGFDELFDEGVVLAPELRLPTNFLGMPGHQLFGGTWSSRNYADLAQDPRIILPNVPIDRQSDSWSLYWNCDQYLYVDPCNPSRGWGLFARAGVADPETNPVESFYSVGIGGNSLLRHRSADTFGAGWYYAKTSDELGPLLGTVFGDGQGMEMFYNVAVTPWLHVTPDLQVIEPANRRFDTATTVGLRTQIIF
ncbi:Carbohydrate-selective porin, OprB family [Rubripirellula lacrimiformis]|uniref:Carbohydrate-selective porin, OprB family n=1 Tax=Rubripirellula lacrimiformis TaxID=1930273 RepID=A0A517N5Q3_9BACT|nr:carbohydrate porin [Rubripirellula lacrimiformis]QDT02465.1 Carbohydrate-selective porin, OprB family [Rubripirellula lacrimiformis]